MDLKNKKFILFDLDGTVTDSGPGIMNAATYVLKHFGIIETDKNMLRRFVGPPLKDSFRDFYGIAEVDEAVEVFREYYVDKGVYENEIYPHMRELLKELHDAGKILVISSSKLDAMVIKVLEYFNILEYFDITVGSTLDESRSEKSEIIEESFRLIEKLINSEEPITEENCTVRKKSISEDNYTVRKKSISEDNYNVRKKSVSEDNYTVRRKSVSEDNYTVRKEPITEDDSTVTKRLITDDNCIIENKLSLEEIKNMSVMIGDRVFDVNGARSNGVECIGVTYGYGSREELGDADQIVDSVDELIKLFV